MTDATVHPILAGKMEQTIDFINALNNLPSDVTLPCIDEFLLQATTDGPIVSLYDITADAAFWCDIATPTERRVYLGKLLKVTTGQPFGVTAKKRLFVDLWNSFSEADKTAFLNRAATAAPMGAAA